MIALFEQRGASRQALAGNHPLLLTSSSHAWVVESGCVDLFVVRLKQGEPSGKLTPLFRVAQGCLFFGFNRCLDDGGELGIIVRGIPGTVVWALAPGRLLSPSQGTDEAGRIVNGLGYWMGTCIQGIGIKALHRELSAQTAGLLDFRHLVEVFNQGRAAEELDRFHRLFLDVLRRQVEQIDERLREHLQQKDSAAKGAVAAGLRQLTEILSREGKTPPLVGPDQDPLLSVCRLIGAHIKVKIKQAPVAEQDDEDETQGVDPLLEIARASGIRTRQVMLKGRWWIQDCGPLVAYLEENGQPVALLPEGPSRYEFIDPVGGRRGRVRKTEAGRLRPNAHMLYRPFPEKELNWWDLVKFGVANRGRDVFRLLFMGAAGGMLGTFVPLATGILFDSVIPEASRIQLIQVIAALVVAAFAGGLFQMVRGIAMLRIQGGMNVSVQAALWDRVLELPTTFFRQYTAGELTSRTMGIQAINNILTDVVVTSILGGAFGVFNLFLLFYYSPKLAAVALLLVACGVLATAWAGRARVRYLKQLTAVQHKITGMVFQFITGMAKLRITGTERRAYGIWAKLFSRQRRIAFKMARIQNRLEIFNSAYPHLATAGIFTVYVSLTLSDQGRGATLSTGQFLAFMAAFGGFITLSIEMSMGLLSIMSIQPHYENVTPILRTLPEADETKAYPGRLKGEIEVSHVSFRYTEDGPLILKDLSMHIKPGEFVAIVGGSGSGKSTLLRLLLGFETQESGAIFYDGQDLSGIDVRMVRRQMGVVLQNTQLMSGDIFTNIIGAAANLTIDDAWRAAREVGLAEDVEAMPMGMHTIIAEGGGGLSGGQRQRLVIARAIVHNPRILFFDEATSALDNRTQAMVTESLEKLRATRMVIAHRLSTIKNADRIFAMDRGVLVESGTYDELMALDGYFANLAKRQIA